MNESGSNHELLHATSPYQDNKTNIEADLFISLEVIIAIFAFTSNFLVLVALWKFRPLRTPTNWFVASLAAADIAVAIFAIPSAIVLRIGPSVGGVTCMALVTSVLFLTQVSIFSLLLIAVDRFIAIHYPYRYNRFMTATKTRIAVVSAWLLGGLVVIPTQLAWNKSTWTTSSSNKECKFEAVISKEYMVYINFFGCVLPPLLAMGVMYIFIFRSAKKQLLKIYFDVRKIKRVRSKRNVTNQHLKNGRNSYSNTVTQNELWDGLLPPHSDNNVNIISTKPSPTAVPKNDSRTAYLSDTTISSEERKDFLLPRSCTRVTVAFENSHKIVTGCGSTHDNFKPSSSPSTPQLIENYKSEQEDSPKIERNTLTIPCNGITIKQERLTKTNFKTHIASKLARTVTESPAMLRNIKGHRSPEMGQNKSRNTKRKRDFLKKEFHAARSLATVVGVFALCWLPLHMLHTITLFCTTCREPCTLLDLAILLSHANSLMNPIIYAHRLRDFRNAFRKIFSPLLTKFFDNARIRHYFCSRICTCNLDPSPCSTPESSNDDYR